MKTRTAIPTHQYPMPIIKPTLCRRTSSLWLFFTMFCLLLGVFEARAVVWLQSVGNVSGSFLSGPRCENALPIKFQFATVSNSYPVSTWSISLTDGNTTTPHTTSATMLEHDSISPVSTIVDNLGGLPTLDLTGLDAGLGTLALTDPSGTTTSYPFNIVDCASGSAMAMAIYSGGQIAPNRAMPFYVHVANFGPNPTTSVVLEVANIPALADCTVTTISPGMNVVDLGSSQKITVSTGVLGVGATRFYVFELQATPTTVVGSTFTMTAGFATIYPFTDSEAVSVVASLDPNAKYGPPGVGDSHDIAANTALPYGITFENDPSASAPAQNVTITDYLDTTKIDPMTLTFGPVHFGKKIVTPPATSNPFNMTVPYDVDGNPATTADNIYVRIKGSVDKDKFSFTYGKVEWTFESLTAPNGVPPPISVGFLPANLTPPEGDGGVRFTVMQKQNLALGTQITNVAAIVFDVNAAILTPVWTNTIPNLVLPTVAIEQAAGGMVRVIWTGGILEQASTVTANDWTNSPVQISPWTFDPAEPLKFFRVRKQ
jgi:hypothetical protein